MYKKRKVVNQGVADEKYTPQTYCSVEKICRPLSYYVKGGVDLRSEETRRPSLGSDSPEDVSSGEVDLLADPRMSRFDVLDYASTETERRLTEAKTKITKSTE
ncbi:hypothetical protein [Dipodfec virus UOA04_Rod_542]|nr:hypothetical protein [Dipodfec virus UOA04_Rod_542]